MYGNRISHTALLYGNKQLHVTMDLNRCQKKARFLGVMILFPQVRIRFNSSPFRIPGGVAIRIQLQGDGDITGPNCQGDMPCIYQRLKTGVA